MSGAPDLKGLREFSEETDRQSGRFFVGRRAELGLVATATANWTRSVHARHAPPGIVLISGAPGAGKTALLRELLDSPPESAAALAVPLLRLSTEAELAHSLAAALVGPAGRVADRLSPSAVAANLGVAKFEWKPAAAMPATLGELDRGLSVDRSSGTVLLLVDEVQTATPDQVRLLAALHQGATGVPLVPVLAGLSDSGDVLAAGGISRRAAAYDIRLQRLDEGEPAAAVQAMLDDFRVAGADADKARWRRAIEAWSDRWPQHLKTAMTALARELLRTGGDLTKADWGRARRDAAGRRRQGYEARCSPAMRLAGTLLARFLRDTLLPVDEETAVGRLSVLLGKGAAGEMPPAEFFYHLVHQGVLHDGNGDGRFECPIPSFREYLISRWQ